MANMLLLLLGNPCTKRLLVVGPEATNLGRSRQLPRICHALDGSC
jgi:hypothetical protein